MHFNGSNQTSKLGAEMAVADAIRKKRRDCLNGQSRFFVPAGFTKRGNIMSEVQETNDKEVTPEWMAALTFESLADAVPLDDMLDEDGAAERGMSEGIWMRCCAVILQDGDKQLFEKFKDDEAADFWLEWVEHLGEFIESQKAGLEILEACRTRLLVCLHRYAMENFPEEITNN